MKTSQLSDAQLIAEFKQGSDLAFEQLVRRYKSKAYTTIYLLVKDRYVAEDLLQDCFIKVVDKLRAEDYNEEGKFAPWLMRIAHNKAIDFLRREKRTPMISLSDGSYLEDSISYAVGDAEQHTMLTETEHMLRSIIKDLPDSQREVLTLRHFGGLPFAEIAKITGVSINTVLGRMRYALIKLKKELEKRNFVYDPNLYSS